jgi:hypothetical protein
MHCFLNTIDISTKVGYIITRTTLEIKMKRIATLLLLLTLIASLSYSASLADAELNLGVNIDAVFGLIVHDSKASQPSITYPTNPTQWTNLNSVGTSTNPIWLAYDDEGGSQDHNRKLAVSAKTNVSNSYVVTATAAPLAVSGSSSKMGYTVTVNQTTTTVAKSDNTKSINLMTISNATDLTFQTQEFTVALIEDDLTKAGSGLYRTTWTIEITASN